jgi:hypothetical protein
MAAIGGLLLNRSLQRTFIEATEERRIRIQEDCVAAECFPVVSLDGVMYSGIIA